MVNALDSRSGSPWFRAPLWPLAGFVPGCPEFKSSATLVSQLVASCQFGFLILLFGLFFYYFITLWSPTQKRFSIQSIAAWITFFSLTVNFWENPDITSDYSWKEVKIFLELATCTKTYLQRSTELNSICIFYNIYFEVLCVEQIL